MNNEHTPAFLCGTMPEALCPLLLAALKQAGAPVDIGERVDPIALMRWANVIHGLMTDPACVHANILRGTLPLTREQALHIAGMPIPAPQTGLETPRIEREGQDGGRGELEG